jgi:ubiquinone/menaquinone biosynthesis C-methylase UbiE
MAANYDSIAKYYDRIHHLFFGQSEMSAQVEMLDYIRPGSRVLILGGGTGWILEKISAIYPEGLQITYVESSLKMVEYSKTRNWRENRVDFVQATVEDWLKEGKRGEPGDSYQCILTGFFFDNFTGEQATQLVGLMTPLLKERGYWLDADFYYPRGRDKLWQAILLRVMYVSARLICGVEAKRLPDMGSIFPAAGYVPVHTSFHYQRFIRSVVYQKQMPLTDQIYS